jgi:hypothetical protein
MALRWCAAGMLEADHQFRRVNGHLHLPKLRAALDVHFNKNVRADCHDETVNAAGRLPGPPPKFHGTRDNLPASRDTGSMHGFALFILIIGGLFGWILRRCRGAWLDLRSIQGRLGNARRAFRRELVWSAGTVVVAFLVVRALLG